MVHIQGFELEVPVKVCLDRKGCEARRRAAIAAGTLTPTRAEARRALKAALGSATPAGADGRKQPASKAAPRRKKARKARRSAQARAAASPAPAAKAAKRTASAPVARDERKPATKTGSRVQGLGSRETAPAKPKRKAEQMRKGKTLEERHDSAGTVRRGRGGGEGAAS